MDHNISRYQLESLCTRTSNGNMDEFRALITALKLYPKLQSVLAPVLALLEVLDRIITIVE